MRGDILLGMRKQRHLCSHGKVQGTSQALVALWGEFKRLNQPSIALQPQVTLAAPIVCAQAATPSGTTRAMARARTLICSAEIRPLGY